MQRLLADSTFLLSVLCGGNPRSLLRIYEMGERADGWEGTICYDT